MSKFEFSLDYSLKKLTGYMKFITEFLGGPVIGIDSEEERHVLVGTVHGAFANCKKYLPGMFVEVDDYNVLEFLQREVFGSGLYNYTIYGKVASSRLVYYLIMDHFVQRSQYISIKFPAYQQSENP